MSVENQNVDKELMLKELQLLNGVVTEDYDYLIYLLLRDGKFFSDGSKVVLYEPPKEKEVTLEDWFKSIRS